MGEALELSLSEWRRIAIRSENQELKDYLNQFYDMDGSETLVLHPVERDERDTGTMQAMVKRSLVQSLK